MEMRKMEKLGIETSLLGFGCMRFPVENGHIEEVQSTAMLERAIACGVNYIDTAYPYLDGESEPFVGKVLKKYDRSSYYLATKMPPWYVESLEDAKRIFEDQLSRLQTDYIDFYLIHALNAERFKAMKELGIIAYCEQLKAEGRIKYLGFSFHDEYKVFEEIINYRKWDFCQIQYNYMDREEQAGDKGYALAEKLGIPLIIMEPIRGGSLAGYSEDINNMFHEMDQEASIASYALRWVGSHSNVKVILSGMSTLEQVEDNLSTFKDFKPLTEAESKKVEEIVGILKGRVQNGCTGCRYCMPCPAGVNIPSHFRLWNNYHIYQNYNVVKWDWESILEEKEKAVNCIQCGKCEEACPQKLSIRADLVKAQQEMDNPIWQ